MNGRRSRVQRKADRVVKTETDRALNSKLGELVRDRDKALAAAGEAYRKALNDARDARAEARAKAWETYEKRRAALLKKLAGREQAKAA